MKKYLKLLLKIFISAALLYLIFYQIDKDLIISNLKLLNFKIVPVIVVLLILNYVVSSIRWKSLLIFENSDHVSVYQLVSLYFIGSFFNNFMPTSVGGDVYKVYKLGKKIKNTVHAFSATFMERFTGILALVLISILSLYKFLGIGVLLVLVWLVLASYWALKFLKVASRKVGLVKKIYDSLSLYKGKNKVLLFALLTSFLVQLFSVFTQYFVFRSVGVNLPILYSLFAFPLIIMASFFIPSLNGVGVQDILYIQMFSVVGVNKELALSASILFHFFRLAVSLVGGVLYAVEKDS